MDHPSIISCDQILARYQKGNSLKDNMKLWNFTTQFDLMCCPLFLDEIKIVKTVLSQTLMFAMNQPHWGKTNVSSFSMAQGVLRKCPCTLKVCTLRNKESASSNISVSESSAPLLPHFAVCTVHCGKEILLCKCGVEPAPSCNYGSKLGPTGSSSS